MNQAEFTYMGKSIVIQCNENDSMNKIIKSFASKASVNKNQINSLIILYGGNIIKGDEQYLTFNQTANKHDKARKKMSFIVYDNTEKIKIEIKSKEIICPKCKENILIKITNYKIQLFGCKNGHTTFLSFKDFEKSQYIKIICDKCKERYMEEFRLTKFYKCYECNINLCNICQKSHNNYHNIMNYGDIKYCCGKHNNDAFAKYCNDCKMDICSICEAEHEFHNLTCFGYIIPNIRQLKNILEEIKIPIDKCNKDFMKITTRINEAKNNIIDLDLYNEIGKSYEGIIGIVNEVKNNFNSYYNLKKDSIYKNYL